MPAIPGIPNVVQFLIKHKWTSGHNTVNSYHLRSGNPGPYSVGDLTLLASQVSSAWITDVMPNLSTALELVEVETIDRSVSDGSKAVNVTTQAGGDAADPLPLNVSFLYQWSDSAHYRGGHPRTYIPGLTKERSTDGVTVPGGTVAAFNTSMTNFLTSVLAGGPYGSITPLTWVAAHYRRDKLPLLTPTASNITPLGFNATLATQRRRLRKAAHS